MASDGRRWKCRAIVVADEQLGAQVLGDAVVYVNETDIDRAKQEAAVLLGWEAEWVHAELEER